MYTFLAIIIELGAVIGTGILTFSMAKNVWQQTKQALIQDVALKALESKTGINSSAVKSLVGEKPMADICFLIMRMVSLMTLSVTASVK